MTYDPNKEYQTKDGREVLLLPELDCFGNVQGMFRSDERTWVPACWNGETLVLISTVGCHDDLDLVEKSKTHTVWVHVIEGSDGRCYYLADDKRRTEDGISKRSKIKSVARLEITEGEGLEDV